MSFLVNAAKILKFKLKPKNKYADFDFKYSQDFLNEKSELTKEQLNEISKEVTRMKRVINSTHDDDEVVDNLIAYLVQIQLRMKAALKAMDEPEKKTAEKLITQLTLVKAGLRST